MGFLDELVHSGLLKIVFLFGAIVLRSSPANFLLGELGLDAVLLLIQVVRRIVVGWSMRRRTLPGSLLLDYLPGILLVFSRFRLAI